MSFDLPPKKIDAAVKKMKLREDKKQRYLMAAWFIFCTVAVCALLALMFAAIGGDMSGFLNVALYCFFMFGGGFAAAAILLLFTKIQEDLSCGFGCGLYYGTVLIAFIIYKLWGQANELTIVVSLIISALSCYVVWLKKFKENS